MTGREYIQELRSCLHKLDKATQDEIIYDIEEYFSEGERKGRTEEEIIRSLGAPQALSKQYHVKSQISAAEDHASGRNIISAFFAVLGLGFFNLVFALAPFIVLWTLVFAVYIVAVSFVFSGALASILCLFYPLVKDLPYVNIGVHPVVGFLIGLLLANLGAICFWMSRRFKSLAQNLSVRYLKWNVRFFKGGR